MCVNTVLDPLNIPSRTPPLPPDDSYKIGKTLAQFM